ncbi:MAG: gamma-glutamylcyclotransferase [Hyphomonadaceae bacterium]|jgi:cation transport regulator ChaC|nr:gamma-glutamylcyclotransferase [Hyphomonadaceae bacterium]
MNPVLWAPLRLWIRYRRGRLPPASLPDPIWYFAYGSNMNERLFRERRHMAWHEAQIGHLDGHRLVFTAAGGMRPGVSAPANIVAAAGESVWGVLYLLPLRKFARLDVSEGAQYGYLWTDVEDANGNRVPVVTYKVPHAAPEGRPGRQYLSLIQQAARQRGLPAAYQAMLDRVEARQ